MITQFLMGLLEVRSPSIESLNLQTKVWKEDYEENQHYPKAWKVGFKVRKGVKKLCRR